MDENDIYYLAIWASCGVLCLILADVYCCFFISEGINQRDKNSLGAILQQVGMSFCFCLAYFCPLLYQVSFTKDNYLRFKVCNTGVESLWYKMLLPCFSNE